MTEKQQRPHRAFEPNSEKSIEWVEDDLGREFPIEEGNKERIPIKKKGRTRWLLMSLDRIINGLDVCCKYHEPIIDALNNDLVINPPNVIITSPSSDKMGYVLSGCSVREVLSDGRINRIHLRDVDDLWDVLFDLMDEDWKFSWYCYNFEVETYCERRGE